jgi:hypothetical protein
MPISSIPARRFGAVLMAALMGVLVGGSLPPTIAQEPTERKRNPAVALDMPRSHDALADLAETTIDAAVRSLLCVEVRAAINLGQLERPGRQWVLAHAALEGDSAAPSTSGEAQVSRRPPGLLAVDLTMSRSIR